MRDALDHDGISSELEELSGGVKPVFGKWVGTDYVCDDNLSSLCMGAITPWGLVEFLYLIRTTKRCYHPGL